MAYTLFNKQIKRRLIHPTVGLWFTNDLEEAEEMLAACHEYLDASGMSNLKADIVLYDVDQGEEIITQEG